MEKNRLNLSKYLGGGIFIVSFFMLFSYVLEKNTLAKIDEDDTRSLIRSCISETAENYGAGQGSSSFEALANAYAHCLKVVYNSLYLEDFRLRRQRILDQRNFEPLILILVVLVTLSGVGLAVYQVFASYRLAEKFRMERVPDVGGEISKTDAGFVIKTTVTGLLILVVSFAFFITYLEFVYEIDVDRVQNSKDKEAIENVNRGRRVEIKLSDSPKFKGGGVLNN